MLVYERDPNVSYPPKDDSKFLKPPLGLGIFLGTDNGNIYYTSNVTGTVGSVPYWKALVFEAEDPWCPKNFFTEARVALMLKNQRDARGQS